MEKENSETHLRRITHLHHFNRETKAIKRFDTFDLISINRQMNE